MKNPVELLTELADAFTKLERAGAAAASAGRLDPIDSATTEIVGHLEAAIGEGDEITALSNGGIERWWQDISQRSANFQIRSLYQFMSRMSFYFGGQPELTVTPTSGNRHLALGRKHWIKRARFGPPKDNILHFPHVRISGSVPLQYMGSHDAIKSAMRPLPIIRLRLHALRRGTTPFFAPTAVVSTETRTLGFRLKDVQYLPDTERPDYLEEVRLAVREASAAGTHVLCFPELTVTEPARQAVQAELGSTGNGLPFLVLAGSDHLPVNPGWRNAGPIFVRQHASVVVWGEYAKREPFALPVELMAGHVGLASTHERCTAGGHAFGAEDIVRSRHYTVFRTPIGLVAVVICKDALTGESEFADLCRFADHVFVLSMQPTPGWFSSRLPQLSKLHDVGCYYLNAQHAAGEKTECAGWALPTGMPSYEFYYAPIGKNDDRRALVHATGYVDFTLDGLR